MADTMNMSIFCCMIVGVGKVALEINSLCRDTMMGEEGTPYGSCFFLIANKVHSHSLDGCSNGGDGAALTHGRGGGSSSSSSSSKQQQQQLLLLQVAGGASESCMGIWMHMHIYIFLLVHEPLYD
jgi:hypothetical protein